MNLSLAFLFVLFAMVGATSAEGAAKPNPRVALETSKGTIVLELFADKAPKSVDNFLQYVQSGFYDGTIFHRVIKGFMIQGGGFDSQGKQKSTRPPIQNESNNGVGNDRGTIAMARTNDVNSATAQFFINHKNNTGLNYPQNGGYAVFGKVVEGMDVVDKIADVPVARGGLSEAVPNEPVTLKKATVVTAGKS